MALNFEQGLKQSLDKIKLVEHQELLVYNEEKERTFTNSDSVLAHYGDMKWKIIDILNDTFNTSFCLSHWLQRNNDDEVSYFLNEAGSNVLSYSEFKAPHKFHLWLGKKGFVIGIEQKGRGFDAERIHRLRLKENEGAAFDFFRNCKSNIFFDDPKEAKMVFMEYLF